MINMPKLKELLEKGRVLETQGEYNESYQCLTKAVESAKTSNDPLAAELFNQRGIVLRMLERYNDAKQDYQEALKSNPSAEQKSLAYINMADIQRIAESDFNAAHSSLDEALKSIDNGSLIHAKAIDQRGLVFVGQKDYASAVACYEEARDICEALIKKNPENRSVADRLGQIIHHLGVAYIFLNDPEKVDGAYKAQMTALDILSKLQNQQGIVNCVTTIGEIAAIKKDYDEAIKHYDKAMKILEQTGSQRSIAAVSFYLVEAYSKKGQIEGGKRFLEFFRKGVLKGYLTKHDLNLLKDKFNDVKNLCADAGLDINGLESYFE